MCFYVHTSSCRAVCGSQAAHVVQIHPPEALVPVNQQPFTDWLSHKETDADSEPKGPAGNENCKSETFVKHTWSAHAAQTLTRNSNRRVFSCISVALHCILYTCLLPRKGHNQFSNPNIKNTKECAKQTKNVHRCDCWDVFLTCTFSFLFGCRLCSSLGSWEAVFSVVDPWWRYKALLTARGGGGLESSQMWLLNTGWNSLFLLKLGKNKERKVLEQHEAHY